MYVGHVICPGGVEEERINRLIRRIEHLARHELLPGTKKREWSDARSAVERYLGIGPSLQLRGYLTSKE